MKKIKYPLITIAICFLLLMFCGLIYKLYVHSSSVTLNTLASDVSNAKHYELDNPISLDGVTIKIQNLIEEEKGKKWLLNCDLNRNQIDPFFERYGLSLGFNNIRLNLSSEDIKDQQIFIVADDILEYNQLIIIDRIKMEISAVINL